MTSLDAILEEYPHDSFRRLCNLWKKHCAFEEPARLADIDLMEIYQVVPRLVIIDLEGDVDGAHRYRWRLAGNDLRFLVGLEMTNRYLDEVATPEMAAESDVVYSDILRGLKPHAWRHRVAVTKIDRSFVEYERLLLPLLGQTGKPEHLIGVYDFDIDATL